MKVLLIPSINWWTWLSQFVLTWARTTVIAVGRRKKSFAIAFTLKLFLGRRKWKAVHNTIPAKGGVGLEKVVTETESNTAWDKLEV